MRNFWIQDFLFYIVYKSCLFRVNNFSEEKMNRFFNLHKRRSRRKTKKKKKKKKMVSSFICVALSLGLRLWYEGASVYCVLLPWDATIFQRIYSYAKCFTVIMKFIPNHWIPCGPVPVHHNKELTGLWVTKNCIELAGISSPECDALSANSDLSIECVSTCTSFLFNTAQAGGTITDLIRKYRGVQPVAVQWFSQKRDEREIEEEKTDNRKVKK